MKLLIVDDEKIEREALRRFFTCNDLEVNVVGEATNGLQAVELNRSLRPDIFIMDIRMSIMDGLTAMEHIKKDNSQAEVIILTAFGLFEYSQQAIRAKVFDYLLKPVEASELRLAIQKVVYHIKTTQKLQAKSSETKFFNCWLKENVQVKGGKENPVFQDERIAKIIQFIFENVRHKLTLERLADIVYMNPNYLSRFFKVTTGLSLGRFILEVRIEKAKLLLMHDKNRTISSISEEVGFTNIQHFCNTFKRVTGETPAKYRM